MENLEPLFKLLANSESCKSSIKKIQNLIEMQIMDEINKRVDEEIQEQIIDNYFIQMNQE